MKHPSVVVLLLLVLLVAVSGLELHDDHEAASMEPSHYRGHHRRRRRPREGEASDGSSPPSAPRPAPPTPPGLCLCNSSRDSDPMEPGRDFFGAPSAPGGNSSSSPADCFLALAGLSPCFAFLTGVEETTPAPQTECCRGIRSFLNMTAASGGDRTLRCLCPVIVGDVNKMLTKPVDPVRMMYLPIACGVVLPPQVLFVCFTGHPAPGVVGRFSQVWEQDIPSSP